MVVSTNGSIVGLVPESWVAKVHPLVFSSLSGFRPEILHHLMNLMHTPKDVIYRMISPLSSPVARVYLFIYLSIYLSI